MGASWTTMRDGTSWGAFDHAGITCGKRHSCDTPRMVKKMLLNSPARLDQESTAMSNHISVIPGQPAVFGVADRVSTICSNN